MKKILKNTVAAIAFATLMSTPATSDTGGYALVKGFESNFHAVDFKSCKAADGLNAATVGSDDCLFASTQGDADGGAPENFNTLRFTAVDGMGVIAGADYGFFRAEIEATAQQASAVSWRNHGAHGGDVWQARIFGNLLVEPFDLVELVGEFAGFEPLVKYNPAHYGVSPYALIGYGIMGGAVADSKYDKDTYTCQGTGASMPDCGVKTREDGAWGGGATAAVNAGFGLNIGLDQFAKGVSALSGTTLPDYFKLPVEFRVGWGWQVGLDEFLFQDAGEKMDIHDDGFTYAVGMKW